MKKILIRDIEVYPAYVFGEKIEGNFGKTVEIPDTLFQQLNFLQEKSDELHHLLSSLYNGRYEQI